MPPLDGRRRPHIRSEESRRRLPAANAAGVSAPPACHSSSPRSVSIMTLLPFCIAPCAIAENMTVLPAPVGAQRMTFLWPSA
jgi:hypothetical protein